MKRELKMKRVSRIFLAFLTAGLLLALPAGAVAAPGDPASDPTASQYENPGSTVTQNDETVPSDDETVALVNTPTSTDSGGGSSSGSLPFTGLDVGILALVALLLGATGLALRRFSAVK